MRTTGAAPAGPTAGRAAAGRRRAGHSSQHATPAPGARRRRGTPRAGRGAARPAPAAPRRHRCGRRHRCRPPSAPGARPAEDPPLRTQAAARPAAAPESSAARARRPAAHSARRCCSAASARRPRCSRTPAGSRAALRPPGAAGAERAVDVGGAGVVHRHPPQPPRPGSVVGDGVAHAVLADARSRTGCRAPPSAPSDTRVKPSPSTSKPQAVVVGVHAGVGGYVAPGVAVLRPAGAVLEIAAQPLPQGLAGRRTGWSRRRCSSRWRRAAGQTAARAPPTRRGRRDARVAVAQLAQGGWQAGCRRRSREADLAAPHRSARAEGGVDDRAHAPCAVLARHWLPRSAVRASPTIAVPASRATTTSISISVKPAPCAGAGADGPVLRGKIMRGRSLRARRRR